MKLYNLTYEQYTTFRPPFDSVVSANREDDEVIVELSEEWWRQKKVDMIKDICAIIYYGTKGENNE